MKKIYGNDNLIKNLRKAVEQDKSPHAVIFHGESGSGKKTIADYYIQMLLCENSDSEKPCGFCKSCRNAENHVHPDVVYVKTEGKTENYSVNSIRDVIADAFIKPNNKSGKKIFVFRDCRKMSLQTQNMLLKLIEEPPCYAYFIFTTTSKYEFLETVISRCTSFAVSVCKTSETRTALAELGYSENETENAVSLFHGNIGKSIEYLSDEKFRRQIDLTKLIADSIIKGSEYELNVVFSSAGTSRNELYDILSALDKTARDCAVLSQNKNAETIGLFHEQAVQLSEILSPYKAICIHELIENAWKAVQANVSVPLVTASLCASIMKLRN